MTSFDTAFKAFQQSQITFDALLSLARQIGVQSAREADAALGLLDSEYHAGRLPEQVYRTLLSALSDETRIAAVPATNTDSLPPIQDDATRILNKVAADDATRILSSEIKTADATFVANSPKITTSMEVPASTQQTLNTESLLNGFSNAQPQAELTVGSTLKNRFVLQQLLGTGGMGMVFKATDLRKVEAADKEPYVALKVLNQDFQNNPMSLVALQRETKRAQTLSHPNIIKVFDFDRDGGHVFMSMEYLEGKPLSQLIRRNPDGLPYKQVWPIIHAMADALRHAHSKNIVHSDFKPGNVFVDDSGDVRVLDFGIACAIGRGEKEHQDATVFNARALGAMTPAYASLEQLQNQAPDPRDDIYALACVAYELLTGKHPFGRLSAEKALEVNLQVKPVPKLSRRNWKGLQKALALKQEQRTASLDEFIKDLGPRSTVFYGLWGTGIAASALFAVNIYLNLIAPPPVLETPKVAVQLTAEQQQKIEDLLELAVIHADVGYLTAPTGSNALWAYQEVLKIDPYNNSAMDGIVKIADILEQQAWEAYEKNDKSTALKKVQEGLEAYPEHKGLLQLREKLRASS